MPSRAHCLDSAGPFRYRSDVLDRLWAHSAHPTGRTRPELARGFVRDLYKYEIRRLRDRMLDNQFPRADYASRVDALRRRYAVLALPASQWIERP